MAFEHDGFWQPMDTLRDKMQLEELFQLARRRGKYGHRPQLLERKACFPYRPYGVQGRLADTLARDLRRPCDRLFAGPAERNQSLQDCQVRESLRSITTRISSIYKKCRRRSLKRRRKCLAHGSTIAVRRAIREPVYTMPPNIMGTAHVLEAARLALSVKAVLVITSDKCYENFEHGHPYRESDRLGGHDPYTQARLARN